MFPDRFSNKTNGVTPRRRLLMANPFLARLLTDTVGTGWVTGQHGSASPLGRPGRRRRLPRPVLEGQARCQGPPPGSARRSSTLAVRVSSPATGPFGNTPATSGTRSRPTWNRPLLAGCHGKATDGGGRMQGAFAAGGDVTSAPHAMTRTYAGVSHRRAQATAFERTWRCIGRRLASTYLTASARLFPQHSWLAPAVRLGARVHARDPTPLAVESPRVSVSPMSEVTHILTAIPAWKRAGTAGATSSLPQPRQCSGFSGSRRE